MPTRYESYLERKKREYGEKFDTSDLAAWAVPYFNSGDRIEVSFRTWPEEGGKEYERARGTIGVTTGWKPTFILLARKNAISSSRVIHAQDRRV